MNLLNSELKIFNVRDEGENFYIVANCMSSAEEYYLESDYFEGDKDNPKHKIVEVPKDTDIRMSFEDDTEIYIVANKYRIEDKHLSKVNIYHGLYWILLKNMLQEQTYGSSFFTSK